MALNPYLNTELGAHSTADEMRALVNEYVEPGTIAITVRRDEHGGHVWWVIVVAHSMFDSSLDAHVNHPISLAFEVMPSQFATYHGTFAMGLSVLCRAGGTPEKFKRWDCVEEPSPVAKAEFRLGFLPDHNKAAA